METTYGDSAGNTHLTDFDPPQSTERPRPKPRLQEVSPQWKYPNRTPGSLRHLSRSTSKAQPPAQPRPSPGPSTRDDSISPSPDLKDVDESKILTNILTSIYDLNNAALALTKKKGGRYSRHIRLLRQVIKDPKAQIVSSLDDLGPAVEMLDAATERLLEMAWMCRCREDAVDGKVMVMRGRRAKVVVCDFCQGRGGEGMDVVRSREPGDVKRAVGDDDVGSKKEVKVRGFTSFERVGEFGMLVHRGESAEAGGEEETDSSKESREVNTLSGSTSGVDNSNDVKMVVEDEAGAQLRRELRAAIGSG